jgi:transposase
MKKIDFRKLSEESRTNMRTQAIKLYNSGYKQKQLSEIFGVNKNTVSNWVRNYKEHGTKGLIEHKRGIRSSMKKLLSDTQEREIQDIVVDKTPDQMQLPFALWNRKAVTELIENKYGITLALNTTGDYLRSWGFSPQRPKKKAYEQNDKCVKKWLEEDYPQIKKRAKEENASIHWGDETGVRNTNNYARSYAPKGQTPTQTIKAKRLSINMISSITNQGRVDFMIYSGTLNSEMFLNFLRQLIKTKDKKIFLIVDNLKVHHSKIVTDWVTKNKHSIELFFLPSYSPEKNPDEYLNCDLKISLANKPSPKSQSELKGNLKNHMEKLSKDSNKVKRFFNHKEVKYAA